MGGVHIASGSYRECVDALIAVAASGKAVHVHFVNAYVIALAEEDEEYRRVLREGLCLTDGTPVAWFGRWTYTRSREEWERVYGPDVMETLLATPGLRHYLLGGSEQTLTSLRRVIDQRWPEAQVVGANSPPFRPLTHAEQRAQDAAIVASGADVVWVGLGTPKQDWEAARVAASTGRMALAVGAAFDFIAGTKPQAPQWMQRSGTEWAFRLATEPRRLARRYLWGNPRFLLAVAKHPGLRRHRV